MKLLLLFTLNLLSACFNQSKPDRNANQTKIEQILPRNDTSKKSLPERGNLTGTVTISVSYAAIACSCAQWFETKHIKVPFLEGVERFYLFIN